MRNNNKMDILWVGKFDFRKQLGLALKIMGQLKAFPNIHLHILGTGNDEENAKYHKMAVDLGVNDAVTFYGRTPHNEVIERMRVADLFLFTSISDATSTVVVEALGCSLPVVCFDACGFGPVITNEVGRKIPFTTPDRSIIDFRNAILELYSQPELLQEMSKNCAERCRTLEWGHKAKRMVELYKEMI